MQMKELIACGFISFCVSGFTMPILVTISKRLGALSELGERHVGKLPIGRLGGFGILLGMVFSVICISMSYKNIRDKMVEVEGQVIGIVLGLSIVSLVGFWDDLRRLPAIYKLVGQVIAAAIAYSFGLKISAIDSILFGTVHLGWFSLPITMLWIVGVVNAVNLIDGLDGLAGGVLLFASVVNFTAAIISEAIFPAVLMVAMVGGVLGFLLYNWYPAKIYLGDGGAYCLGFVLSIGGLLAPFQKASTSVALMVPILAVGLPIFDTLLTIFRRFVKRRGIFVPDRGHLHHILLDSGISHKRVVIGLYLICCALCSTAILIVLRRNREFGVLLLFSSVCACAYWGFSVRSQLLFAMKKIVGGHSKC
jgi:UDP-GlcNAc:undecaprenyl-phosphate GlcNAc-1-phosphate transferase